MIKISDLNSYSKNITKKHGKNYARAVSFFPSDIRSAVYLYYAWLRYADQLVDTTHPGKENSQEEFLEWKRGWFSVVHGYSGHPLHEKMFQLAQKYDVPLEYFESFLGSMESDLFKKKYKTYQDLQSYMYGSAVIVGFTMLCFFGLHKKDLLHGAQALGEAMQLANFLRDIREDYEDLNRIYLPQEDMLRFCVKEKDIASHSLDDNFKNLMKFEIARCRQLYAQAWPAIERLPWRIKFPLRVATRNYQGVLDQIEKSEYDVWSQKHSLSKWQKLQVFIQSFIS
jgi:phytoene synthase